MELFPNICVGDLVTRPVYGRIEDIWIGNAGIWIAVVNGLNIPIGLIGEVISREILPGGKEGILWGGI